MMDEISDAVSVLDRMTQILQAFDQNDSEMGLSEIARHSGLPKSTVSRLVATLLKHGYLERDGRLIHLGLRVFELGQLARAPRELRAAALPIMMHLRDRTGDDVHLAIPDGGEMICIAAVQGRSHAPSRMRVGARLPAHATALGKVMLAHTARPMLEEHLRVEREALTPRTITDEGMLRRQLVEICGGGIAIAEREFDPEISCAAVGLFGSSGALTAALSISRPAQGFDPTIIAPPLHAAAQALMRRPAVIASMVG
jgi:IclR family transcriptional regulator, acetate operon repressor